MQIFFFFFQIKCQLGWVISHLGERVQVHEEKSVVQTGNNNEQVNTVQCAENENMSGGHLH